MADRWYLVAIVGLAVVAVLVLLARRKGSGGGGDARQGDARPNQDFAAEREGDRLAHMSEEDRAWEAGSLRRDRDRQQARGDPQAGPQRPLS